MGRLRSLVVATSALPPAWPRVDGPPPPSASGLATVRFHCATGSAALPGDASDTLKAIAQLLKDRPTRQRSVQGPTDHIGQAADLGAEQPMADKRTDASRASNRRGELVRC